MSRSSNKKHKEEPAHVWIVTVTPFEDDYQIPRGEERSYNEDPRAFDTQKKAELYMASELFEWLSSEDRLCEEHKEVEEYLQYEEPDRYLVGIKPELNTDYEKMRSVVLPYTKGRHVPYKIDWQISKVDIE